MTVTTYRNGIMAADSGQWSGDWCAPWGRKLPCLHDGTLIGVSGESAAAVEAAEAAVDHSPDAIGPVVTIQHASP